MGGASPHHRATKRAPGYAHASLGCAGKGGAVGDSQHHPRRPNTRTGKMHEHVARSVCVDTHAGVHGKVSRMHDLRRGGHETVRPVILAGGRNSGVRVASEFGRGNKPVNLVPGTVAARGGRRPFQTDDTGHAHGSAGDGPGRVERSARGRKRMEEGPAGNLRASLSGVGGQSESACARAWRWKSGG